MKTVAIFGVGLIGGSFALALRRAGFTGEIIGVSSPETVEKALELQVIDRALSEREAAESADLLYLSQPILRIIEVLPRLNDWVRTGALVTDAGSTKKDIVAAGQSITRCQFLGGHPMAGREKRGVEAAEAELFEGRPYVLTPLTPAAMESPQARDLLAWTGGIGASAIVMTPEDHDRVVAFTSHLPQLASTALASLLSNRKEPASGVFGHALVDSTRLALSSYEIWGDIVDTNRDAIRLALQAYIHQLEKFSQALERNGLSAPFEQAAQFASQLRSPDSRS